MRGILTDGLLGLACLALASCMGCAYSSEAACLDAGHVWHGMEERCIANYPHR